WTDVACLYITLIIKELAKCSRMLQEIIAVGSAIGDDAIPIRFQHCQKTLQSGIRTNSVGKKVGLSGFVIKLYHLGFRERKTQLSNQKRRCISLRMRKNVTLNVC